MNLSPVNLAFSHFPRIIVGMSKKILAVITALTLTLTLSTPLNVLAEPDYTDTGTWNATCSKSTLTSEEKASCTAYVSYMMTEVANYNTQISSLNGMIEDMNVQIADMQSQIEAKQAEIDTAQAQIDEKQKVIDELKARVKSRIETEQSTMKSASMVDVIMGAKSLDDLVRIANGLSDITDSDTQTTAQLSEGLDELNAMRDSLQTEMDDLTAQQTDLETGKAVLDGQQETLTSAMESVAAMESALATSLSNATLKANTSTATAGNSNNSSSSSDSSWSGGATGDSSNNPYWGGESNCTWEAWQLVHDILGISLPGLWGNAGAWLGSAAASGYATGSAPAVNSIVVFYSHVAFVDSVNGDSIHIREGGWNGGYNERTISGSQGNIQGYIYF